MSGPVIFPRDDESRVILFVCARACVCVSQRQRKRELWAAGVLFHRPGIWKVYTPARRAHEFEFDFCAIRVSFLGEWRGYFYLNQGEREMLRCLLAGFGLLTYLSFTC